MKKAITPNQHIAALALFTMANQHYLKAARYGEQLSVLLGGSTDDFILGDMWLQEGPDFDQAFKDAGFTIRKPKKRKVRKAKRK